MLIKDLPRDYIFDISSDSHLALVKLLPHTDHKKSYYQYLLHSVPQLDLFAHFSKGVSSLCSHVHSIELLYSEILLGEGKDLHEVKIDRRSGSPLSG